MLFGAQLTQYAKEAAITRGHTICGQATMRAIGPACGERHEMQSLCGAAKPQPAPAFRRTAHAVRKKGRDYSRPF